MAMTAKTDNGAILDDWIVVVFREEDAEALRSFGVLSATVATDVKADDRPLAVLIPFGDDYATSKAPSVVDYAFQEGFSRVKQVYLPILRESSISKWLTGPGAPTLRDLRDKIQEARFCSPSSNGTGGGPGATAHDSGERPNLTELGNARRMIARHGDKLRFCKSMGDWLWWDGRRWARDQIGAVQRFAKETVRLLGREASETLDDDERQRILRWALSSEQRRVINNMIELAWSEPEIAIRAEELDANPWLLNCPNGTVDLRTGQLRPHEPGNLITKITSVSFEADMRCPRWEAALETIFQEDPDLVAFVQRALGYSLTGDVGEHAMFLCHGTGRNGKNTVLDTVRLILSDYARSADPKTFLLTGKNEHPAMLADLMGRRFVLADEVEGGAKLAESLVKQVTGNQTIKARFMRQNPFEFPVLFKLWMMVNEKPDVRGQDEGIWSRIRVIPFEHYFPSKERVKNFSAKLIRDEGPGILAWLVRGCLEWQRDGLKEPKRVIDATKAYRREQDVIARFLEDQTEDYRDKSTRYEARANAGQLYQRYVSWCGANGESALSQRRFGDDLTRRRYDPLSSNGTRYRIGMKLKHGENGDPE